MAAVSFAGTKSSNPSDKDLSDLYYAVEYLRATQDIGHILHTSVNSALRLYCEVDTSYLLHPDSKGHTGYTISFCGTTGTFTIAASNRPPSLPYPLMPKRAQYSRSPRNSIFSLLSARKSRSPSNYLQSLLWKTTVRSLLWPTMTQDTPRSVNTS